MSPNSTPPEGLYGPVAASDVESKDRGAGTANGPQAGAQGPKPRDVIRDLIHTTLNAGSYWLPIEGQHAIADAVLAALSSEIEVLRRVADPQGLRLVDEMLGEVSKLHTAQDSITRAQALHRNDGGLCAECSTEQRGALWPCNTIAALDPAI